MMLSVPKAKIQIPRSQSVPLARQKLTKKDVALCLRTKRNVVVTHAKKLDESKIPEDLICPITRELMQEPVVLVETGHVYDRDALALWLSSHSTCPKTNIVLRSKQIAPVQSLKLRIKELRANYSEVRETNGAPKQNTSGKVNLSIRRINGKQLKVQASPEDSIQTLKAKITDILGVPQNQFKLNCNGRELRGGTISQNGIHNQANLIMTMRFSGGSTAPDKLEGLVKVQNIVMMLSI